MTIVEYTIAADTDDGSFRWSGGTWTKYNDTFVFGHIAARYMRGFCRWALNIPAGSTILSADIYFQAANTVGGATTFQVALIDEANCPDMDYWDADQSNMTLVVGTVAWTPDDWVGDEYYATPSLVDLVQAFVDMAGYASGNYIGLRIDEGTGTYRRQPYDFSEAGSPAVLRVTYAPGPSDRYASTFDTLTESQVGSWR